VRIDGEAVREDLPPDATKGAHPWAESLPSLRNGFPGRRGTTGLFQREKKRGLLHCIFRKIATLGRTRRVGLPLGTIFMLKNTKPLETLESAFQYNPYTPPFADFRYDNPS